MKEEMKGSTESILAAGVSRRKFLSYAGLASAATLFVASCKRDDDKKDPVPDGTINLGSGDAGVMNFAYALEQLEAAFYIKVCSSFYNGVSKLEMSLLTDIRAHEIAHREFLRNVIGDAAIIPNLEFDFSSVDFTSRSSVLATASAFEDLGVAAYNGAAQLISTTDYLIAAGKIASVEARHAAVLHELLTINSFADTTNGDGMDPWKTPDEVLSIADKYFVNKVSSKNLPKS
jgi:hypothetical protein